MPPRAQIRLKRPDINRQSFCTYSAMVICWSYLTSKKIGKGLQNVRLPSTVTLCCQAASAQFRLRKNVSHLDVLRVNIRPGDHFIYFWFYADFAVEACIYKPSFQDSLFCGKAIISIGLLSFQDVNMACMQILCAIVSVRCEPGIPCAAH